MIAKTADNLVTSDARIGLFIGISMPLMSTGGLITVGLGGAIFGAGLSVAFWGLGLIVEKAAAKIINHLPK